MAMINYNGMELEEFTSDKPVIFDPPKTMVVTDDYDCRYCRVAAEIIVYDPRRTVCKAIGIHNQSWRRCFLLPDPPKPRRATNRELARWLIEGNAQIRHSDSDMVYVGWNYKEFEDDLPCSNNVLVRKWSDAEWREPTVDYMGLEDV